MNDDVGAAVYYIRNACAALPETVRQKFAGSENHHCVIFFVMRISRNDQRDHSEFEKRRGVQNRNFAQKRFFHGLALGENERLNRAFVQFVTRKKFVVHHSQIVVAV